MFGKERQDKIYDMIRRNGAVSTSKLVKLFNVSIETVRRDLLNMEKQGKLQRVHGGAVAKGEMKPFLQLQERNKENNPQKRSLSLKAMEFISEGDTIAIDSGSTAIYFAEALKEKFSRLTVVTHSIDVFNILCRHGEFSVILCGGHFNREESAFYGALTLETLGNLHIQKAFVCPSAISIDYGICDYNHDLYLIQRQLISSSDEIYILADSSKFERKALLKISEMKTEYTYITDSLLYQEMEELYKENSINIYKGEDQ